MNRELVIEKLNPMIPSGFNDIWRKGLETGSYYLKLCGSGGGGFERGQRPCRRAVADFCRRMQAGSHGV